MAGGATIAVILRFYTRLRITRNVGLDDWLMLVALVRTRGHYSLKRSHFLPIVHSCTALTTWVFNQIFSWGVSGPGLASAHYGMGRHIGTLDPPDITRAIMYVWYARLSTIVAFCFVKLAIATLLLRVMTVTKKSRYILLGSVAVNVSVSIVWFIMTIKCIPASNNWNRDLGGKCIPNHVTTNHAYFAGGKLAPVHPCHELDNLYTNFGLS